MISGYCKCGNAVSHYERQRFKKCSKCYEDEFTLKKLKEFENREQIKMQQKMEKERLIEGQQAFLANQLNALLGKTIKDVRVVEFVKTNISEELRSVLVEFTDQTTVAFTEEKEHWSESKIGYLSVKAGICKKKEEGVN